MKAVTKIKKIRKKDKAASVLARRQKNITLRNKHYEEACCHGHTIRLLPHSLYQILKVFTTIIFSSIKPTLV